MPILVYLHLSLITPSHSLLPTPLPFILLYSPLPFLSYHLPITSYLYIPTHTPIPTPIFSSESPLPTLPTH